MKLNTLFILFLILLYGCAEKASLETARKQYNAGQFEQAFNMLKPLAEKGNPKAQFIWAGMLYDGSGSGKDFKRAFEYFQKSANQNYPPAQFILSQLYSEGKVVENNNTLAFEWLEKSAENGFALAQYTLAVKYYEGIDVKENAGKAFYWAEKAAKQKQAEAQYLMGVLYIDGVAGVKSNPEKGFKYIVSSAQNGYNFAQIILGIIFLIGDDYEEAKKWLDKARTNKLQEVSYLNGEVLLEKVPEIDAFKKTINVMRENLKQENKNNSTDISGELFKICNYAISLAKAIKKGKESQTGNN